VSLIRHGRVVVEQDRVELRAVLTTAVEEVRLLYPDTEVRLKAGSRRAEIVGDRLRLRQVLSNLLVNAVTHGASAEPVDVSLRVGHDAAVITVEDRGAGIPPALLPDLFTPFAAASQDGTSGLGLGLFLAHQISIEHGGTLSVEPRRGGGTAARLTFPIGDAPAAGAPRRTRSRTEVPQ
jgi:signal transduction histidine kinase